MFLLYYVWGFFFYIFSLTNKFIEVNFLKQNNPFLIRKRTFKFISYFEKLFLVLFYRKGWFEESIANLYRKKDIIDYRRENYPLIFFFHLYYDKMDYQLKDLKLLVKQYNFYINNIIFKKKLIKLFNFCFKLKNNKFIKFLMIQRLFFTRYYNSHSYILYNDYNNLNTVKLNFFFNLFLLNSKGRFVSCNLHKWNDWYFYAFNKKIIKSYKMKSKLGKKERRAILDFKKKTLENWIKMVKKYKKIYYFPYKHISFLGMIIINIRMNFVNYFRIKFKKDLHTKLKNFYTIRFSDSSMNKYINSKELKKYTFFYLRKNRIFNKGRYSRNRQLYRTGVYWCLWLNIIMVYGLYFLFYRFSFNFGYIWWGILILAFSTIFSRIIKYNFYNFFYLYKEFLSIQKWYGYIVYGIIELFKDILIKYFNKINIFNYIRKYKNNKFNFFYDNYYYYLLKFFKSFLKKKNIKIAFFWQGMKEKDTSWFRYKTIIHWCVQMYRLLTIW